MCHWSPHPDQHPRSHDDLNEVFPAHLGDDSTDRLYGEQKDTRHKTRRCTETVCGVGAIKLSVRHNTFMRTSMKTHVIITQHILVMITLHMYLTFTIHVGIAQCACVSKLVHGDFSTFIEISMKAFNAHVVITKHIQVDQKYCPDVSIWKSQNIQGDCISSAIIHIVPPGDRYQRDGCVHMTSWEGHTRLIGLGVSVTSGQA